MRSTTETRPIFWIATLAIVITGCGPQMRQGFSPLTSGVANLKGRDMGSKGAVIYVTTPHEAIVLSLATLEMKATLPLSEGEGVCTDPRNGNAYFPESSAIVAYARNASSPFETLEPPSGYDYLSACAVDPNSGDLAVSATGPTEDKGAILVYPGGQGTANIYSDKHLGFYGYPAYDDSGEIYFHASRVGVGEQLERLNVASHRFVPIKLTIGFGYDKLVWDGTYLDFEEFYGRGSGSEMLQLKISGGIATIVNRINLYGAGTPSNFSISQGSLVNALVQTDKDRYSGVGMWSYPGGGKPEKKNIKVAKGIDQIFDVSISAAGTR